MTSSSSALPTCCCSRCKYTAVTLSGFAYDGSLGSWDPDQSALMTAIKAGGTEHEGCLYSVTLTAAFSATVELQVKDRPWTLVLKLTSGGSGYQYRFRKESTDTTHEQFRDYAQHTYELYDSEAINGGSDVLTTVGTITATYCPCESCSRTLCLSMTGTITESDEMRRLESGEPSTRCDYEGKLSHPPTDKRWKLRYNENGAVKWRLTRLGTLNLCNKCSDEDDTPAYWTATIGSDTIQLDHDGQCAYSGTLVGGNYVKSATLSYIAEWDMWRLIVAAELTGVRSMRAAYKITSTPFDCTSSMTLTHVDAPLVTSVTVYRIAPAASSTCSLCAGVTPKFWGLDPAIGDLEKGAGCGWSNGSEHLLQMSDRMRYVTEQGAWDMASADFDCDVSHDLDTRIWPPDSVTLAPGGGTVTLTDYSGIYKPTGGTFDCKSSPMGFTYDSTESVSDKSSQIPSTVSVTWCDDCDGCDTATAPTTIRLTISTPHPYGMVDRDCTNCGTLDTPAAGHFDLVKDPAGCTWDSSDTVNVCGTGNTAWQLTYWRGGGPGVYGEAQWLLRANITAAFDPSTSNESAVYRHVEPIGVNCRMIPPAASTWQGNFDLFSQTKACRRWPRRVSLLEV